MMSEPIPIREISRLTGVNTVTLRAWERRYGLLKPLRTAKGHRLYRHEDVELVKKIQAWLARGLAIGKVSELLENGQQENSIEVENIWTAYYQQLLAIIAELSPTKLDAFLNQLFAVYPVEIIADQLISPVLENLNQPTFGNNIKKSIFVNRTCEYLFMLIQRQRQQANGKRVAIIQLAGETNLLTATLLHYGLTMNQYRSEVIGLISVEEAVLAQQQLSLDALIVYNDSATSLSEFQKALSQLAQKITVSIVVGGNLSEPVSANMSNYPENLYFMSGHGQQGFMNTINNLWPQEAVNYSSEKNRIEPMERVS